MKNKVLQQNLREEVLDFIGSRKSLQLSSLQKNGLPYASYAPFALGEECIYVLLSEVALHAVNLQHNPMASVLIIQDEDNAEELFARVRVNYQVKTSLIEHDSEAWQIGIDTLSQRHGERIVNLSQLSDFKLFTLSPKGGRFVKGFGRAYTLASDSLAGEEVNHLTQGHRKRAVA